MSSYSTYSSAELRELTRDMRTSPREMWLMLDSENIKVLQQILVFQSHRDRLCSVISTTYRDSALFCSQCQVYYVQGIDRLVCGSQKTSVSRCPWSYYIWPTVTGWIREFPHARKIAKLESRHHLEGHYKESMQGHKQHEMEMDLLM